MVPVRAAATAGVGGWGGLRVRADPPDATLAGTDNLRCGEVGSGHWSGVLRIGGGEAELRRPPPSLRAANGAPLVGGRFVRTAEGRDTRSMSPLWRAWRLWSSPWCFGRCTSDADVCHAGSRPKPIPHGTSLVAQKFDGSQRRKALGRPKIDAERKALVDTPGPGESLVGR